MGVLGELKLSYKAKASIENKSSFITRNIYRPLSFYVTVPFALAGFSANQVSVLGLLVALAGMIMFIVGGYALFLIGSMLYFLAAILDYVDGNIARLRGSSSYFGKFLDGLFDTFVSTLLPFAVSIGLYFEPDPLNIFLSGVADPALILLIGALTSLAISLEGFIAYRFKAVHLEVLSLNKNAPSGSGADRFSDASGIRSGIRIKLINFFYGLIQFESFFMLGGIILFALFNILSIFLMIHCVIRVLSLVLECARSLARSRREFGVSRSF